MIIHDIEEKVRRVCILGMEKVRSEARQAEVKALVPLTQQRASYSTSVKVTWKARVGAWDGLGDT